MPERIAKETGIREKEAAFYVDGTDDASPEAEVFMTDVLLGPAAKFGVFSNAFELSGAEPESFMVLLADELPTIRATTAARRRNSTDRPAAM